MNEIGPPEPFVDALLSLRRASVDPSLSIYEAPAPARLSPYAAAVQVDAGLADVEHPIGSSTLVVLYDPDEQENWGGPFRLVGHARIQIDADQSTDPLLGEAIWQTLVDSFDEAGAGFDRLVGSVTREITETFGGLDLMGSVLNADLRCSWSPVSEELAEHLTAWSEALRQNCGLEPSGVTSFGTING